MDCHDAHSVIQSQSNFHAIGMPLTGRKIRRYNHVHGYKLEAQASASILMRVSWGTLAFAQRACVGNASVRIGLAI